MFKLEFKFSHNSTHYCIQFKFKFSHSWDIFDNLNFIPKMFGATCISDTVFKRSLNFGTL